MIELQELRDKYQSRFRGWIPIFDPVSERILPSTGSVRVRIMLDECSDLKIDETSHLVRKHALTQILSSKFPETAESDMEHLKIFLGTWNAASQKPNGDFNNFFIHQNSMDYQIYIFCLQESDFAGSSSSALFWESFISSHLSEDFSLMVSANLWQIRMFMFVHVDLMNFISGLHISDETTGLTRVLSNKGSVAIAFNFKSTKFCVVNSHFEAHQDKVLERNSNYKDAIQGMHIGRSSLDLLNQFDHVIWAGDLNYRLDLVKDRKHTPTSDEMASILSLIDERDYTALLSADQLKAEMHSGKVFIGFSEGKIDFPPTFKFSKGSVNDYNPKRAPAYCDRILWHSAPGLGENIAQLKLSSCPEVTSSDHKPVYTVFDINIPNIPSTILYTPTQEYDSNYPGAFEEDIEGVLSSRLSLSIRNVRAVRLQPISGVGGGAFDVVLKISGGCISEEIESSCISKDLDPEWPEYDLPSILLRTNNPERLHFEHLIITVKGQDRLRLRQNVVLGMGRILISDFLPGTGSDWKSVTISLTKNGQKAGILYLTGSIVNSSRNLQAKRNSSPSPMKSSKSNIDSDLSGSFQRRKIVSSSIDEEVDADFSMEQRVRHLEEIVIHQSSKIEQLEKITMIQESQITELIASLRKTAIRDVENDE